ncbi:unnamed protein product, partial [Mesorhabditis belari]|uniref:C-type lectin domain-containing protein n=1 Tax=Mesorhabditis belari TaxID=2138241 RepID=A0AAF3EGW1_9BILA
MIFGFKGSFGMKSSQLASIFLLTTVFSQIQAQVPDPQCPRGWVYNPDTNFCYYVPPFYTTDGVQWQLYSWTTAESNCQQFGSHLASIHSKKEDDFVQSLVISNVANLTDVVPDKTPNDPCFYAGAWIGYYGNGGLNFGSWTDGSLVDYNGLGQKLPNSYFWLVMNDESCQSKGWGYNFSTWLYARYVCKMPARNSLKSF